MDWFTAAGSIFQGMYDKSKEYQKEDFILRAEELKAEKDGLIRRKNKRYDMEIDSYYKELEKKKEIDSLNSQFVQLGKNADVNAYATKYLMTTDKYWGTYTPEERKAEVFKLAKSIEDGGFKPFSYQMQSQDPDKLDKTLAAEEKLILSKYKDELQKSKDNNFLVNKVLGKSTSVNENAITDAVNAENKASEIVNKTEDTKEFTLSGEAKAPPITIKKEFDKAFGTKKGELVYNSDKELKDDGVQVMIAANLVGADGGGFFKFKNGKIDEITVEGRAFLDLYKTTYNDILNTYTVEDFAKLYPNQRVSEVENLTKDNIHRLTTQAIEQRTVNLDNTGWLDGKKDIKALIHLPFNVLDMDSKINGKSYNGTEVKNAYENFIREVVNNKDLQESRIQNLDDNGERTVAVQNSIMNDGAYKSLFLKYLEENNIKPVEVAEVTTEVNTEVNTEIDTPKDNPDENKTTGKFTLGINNENINSLIVPFDDAILGRKKGDKIPLTKKNIDKLKTLNNEEINSLISEGVKFGTADTNKLAPNLNVIPKFIRNSRGVLIPNPNHPDNKKEKTTTTTSKVNKKKLR